MSCRSDISGIFPLLVTLLCAPGCFFIGYEELPQASRPFDGGAGNTGSNGKGDGTGDNGAGANGSSSGGGVAPVACKPGEARCEGATFVHCDDQGAWVRDDCEDIAFACTEGYCTNEGCKTRPAPDGTGCNDDLYCTKTDTCLGGTCVGDGDACPDTACASQRCDEARERCSVDQTFDGAICGSGLLCSAGACVSPSACASADCSPECPGDDSCSLSCAGATTCSTACDCDGPCTAHKSCTINCQDVSSCLGECKDVRADCKLDCRGSDKCVGDCRGRTALGGGDCDVDCRDARSCTNTCSGGNSICKTDCSGTTLCRTFCVDGANCATTCDAGANCQGACNVSANCNYDCRGAATCQVSCSFASDCILRCDATDVYGSPDCNFSKCEALRKCGNGVFACGRPCPSTTR